MDKIASRHRRTQKRTEGTYKVRLLNSRRKKHRKRGERKNWVMHSFSLHDQQDLRWREYFKRHKWRIAKTQEMILGWNTEGFLFPFGSQANECTCSAFKYLVATVRHRRASWRKLMAKPFSEHIKGGWLLCVS